MWSELVAMTAYQTIWAWCMPNEILKVSCAKRLQRIGRVNEYPIMHYFGIPKHMLA